MTKLHKIRTTPTVLATCAIMAVGGISAARADITTTSPSLPLLNIPYESAQQAGCFTDTPVCVSAGALTITSTISSTFDVTGQHIVANATYTAMLTDLFGTPIGLVDLSGTMQEDVLARTTDADIGTWFADISTLSLSGTVFGDMLTMTQDLVNASNGSTAIADNGDGTYLVTSFFDMFVDLSLNSSPPETVASGPIYFDVTVPEPSSLALLSVPVFALALLRRRHR